MPLTNPQDVAAHAALPNAHHVAHPIAYGDYTGNNSADRAIPHGLGVIPEFVVISGGAAFNYCFRIHLGVAEIFFQNALDALGSGSHTVSIPTTTDFYVGNAGDYPQSANENTRTYYWTAFG